MLQAELARPKDQRVHLQVTGPASLLAVISCGNHAPLARTGHFYLVAEVSGEDEHLTCVVLLRLSIDTASFVLEHVLEIELLADFCLTTGLVLVIVHIVIIVAEDDRIFEFKLLLLSLNCALISVFLILKLLEIRSKDRLERLYMCALHKMVSQILVVSIVGAKVEGDERFCSPEGTAKLMHHLLRHAHPRQV